MLRLLQNPLKLLPSLFYNNYFPHSTIVSATTEVNQPLELDKLYKTIIVEVRGHDRAVLNSYEWFAKTAADHLNVNIANILEPKEIRARRTLLKSVFIYKKHRVQYEFRTYFRIFEIKHITGSTADTYLEYIQRNLPEGCLMKVTKHRIEKLPDHIANYVPEKNLKDSTIEDKSTNCRIQKVPTWINEGLKDTANIQQSKLCST